MDMENKRLGTLVIVAFLVILFFVLINLIFSINIVYNLVICWLLTTFYAIFGILYSGTRFFYVENENKPVIKYIEKPVYVERKVQVQVPVEKKVVEIVEKPVYIEKEVEKKVPVYVKTVMPRTVKRKLNIPKYDYIGSDETMRFHKRSCRLGKLIKRKHKISSNSKEFFLKKGYKQCKACLKRKK